MVQGLSASAILLAVMGTVAYKRKDGILRRASNDIRAIVRTAVHTAGTWAADAVGRVNSGIMQKEQFVATLDSRTTPTCMQYDGQVYRRLMGPKPPLHWNCRSIRVAYISPEAVSERPFNPTTEKQLVRDYAKDNKLGRISDRANLPYGTKTKFDNWARGQRRSLIGRVPGKVDYETFLKRQSHAFKFEQLGAERTKLFDSGVPLIQLMNKRTRRFKTVAQLRRDGLL
jgi:hypothetical protein